MCLSAAVYPRVKNGFSIVSPLSVFSFSNSGWPAPKVIAQVKSKWKSLSIDRCIKCIHESFVFWLLCRISKIYWLNKNKVNSTLSSRVLMFGVYLLIKTVMSVSHIIWRKNPAGPHITNHLTCGNIKFLSDFIVQIIQPYKWWFLFVSYVN